MTIRKPGTDSINDRVKYERAWHRALSIKEAVSMAFLSFTIHMMP